MNFFDNISNFPPPVQGINTPMMINNDINYKINELEQKIKRLEQRITLLESNHYNNEYNEPDNKLYMI